MGSDKTILLLLKAFADSIDLGSALQTTALHSLAHFIACFVGCDVGHNPAALYSCTHSENADALSFLSDGEQAFRVEV